MLNKQVESLASMPVFKFFSTTLFFRAAPCVAHRVLSTCYQLQAWEFISFEQ